MAKSLVKRLIPESQKIKLKSYGNKVRFFGTRYKCPACQSNLRKWLPYGYDIPVLIEKKVIGGGYRENALCPVCRSMDRSRLVYLYLLRKTSFFDLQAKVLHVAPEKDLSKVIKLSPNIDYVTADAREGRAMVQMDITDINYPTNSFDVIICNHVLEHIVDDEKAMTELHRVLKPGGWGILQVPMSFVLDETYEDSSITTPEEREVKFGQYDHVRIYAMDYIERLQKAGFDVDVFKWEDDPEFCADDNKFGLLESERVFVVKKS